MSVILRPGYSLLVVMLLLFAPTTMAFVPTPATAAFAATVATAGPIASARRHHYYRWRDIVEQLGKWVSSWRGIIVIVTIRVAGVASQVAATIVSLSESWTGSKTVVSFPGPTRQNERYP
ncbi:MAG: hypothetical protein ACLQLE_14605 [Desulfobaccales bacterium]